MCLVLSVAGIFAVFAMFMTMKLALYGMGNLSFFIDVGGRLNEAVHSAVLNVRAHDADYTKQSLLKLNAVKDRIALLMVDDETLRDPRFNEWPIPRSRYAEMLDMLERAGATAVGIDVLFIEPQKSHPKADEALKKALAASKSSILVDTVTRGVRGSLEYLEPLPMLVDGWSKQERYARLGFTFEGDESIKSVPLVVDIGGEQRLSFDTLLAAKALGVSVDQVVDHSENGYVQIGDRFVPVDQGAMTVNFYWPGSLTQGEGDVKSDALGDATSSTLSINYYPLSALWDMEPKDRAYYFKDRVVLLGVNAQAGHDIKITPIGKMAGVEVHANAVLTILSGGFVYIVPPLGVFAITVLLCLLVGALMPILDPRIGVVVFLLIEALVVTASYKIFEHYNLWFPPALSFFSVVAAFAFVTIYLIRAERRAKLLMKTLFEKATPVREEDVINFLLSGKTEAEDFETELEVRERTVLFSDIRDYTVMSESMNAERVMKTLNVYYSEMQTVINECGGKIWEYVGDAQMVIFGEKKDGRYPPECQVKPEYAQMNPADQAVHAAINMIERLEKLNAEAREKGMPVLDIGIGINTGPVSLGTIKNKGKLVFAAIGDTTNVAARMQAMSKDLRCRILLAESTYERLDDIYLSERVDNVKVKGKAEPMTVYRIFAGQQARERENVAAST